MGMQKAIVAVIGGLIVVANETFGLGIGVNEAMVESFISALVPILTAAGVYAWPNS